MLERARAEPKTQAQTPGATLEFILIDSIQRENYSTLTIKVGTNLMHAKVFKTEPFEPGKAYFGQIQSISNKSSYKQGDQILVFGEIFSQGRLGSAVGSEDNRVAAGESRRDNNVSKRWNQSVNDRSMSMPPPQELTLAQKRRSLGLSPKKEQRTQINAKTRQLLRQASLIHGFSVIDLEDSPRLEFMSKFVPPIPLELDVDKIFAQLRQNTRGTDNDTDNDFSDVEMIDQHDIEKPPSPEAFAEVDTAREGLFMDSPGYSPPSESNTSSPVLPSRGAELFSGSQEAPIVMGEDSSSDEVMEPIVLTDDDNSDVEEPHENNDDQKQAEKLLEHERKKERESRDRDQAAADEEAKRCQEEDEERIEREERERVALEVELERQERERERIAAEVELRRREEEAESERIAEVRRQEEERERERERIVEVRRQEEERERERIAAVRRQEEERQRERIAAVRRQDEERERERIAEARRQEEERERELRRREQRKSELLKHQQECNRELQRQEERARELRRREKEREQKIYQQREQERTNANLARQKHLQQERAQVEAETARKKQLEQEREEQEVQERLTREREERSRIAQKVAEAKTKRDRLNAERAALAQIQREQNALPPARNVRALDPKCLQEEGQEQGVLNSYTPAKTSETERETFAYQNVPAGTPAVIGVPHTGTSNNEDPNDRQEDTQENAFHEPGPAKQPPEPLSSGAPAFISRTPSPISDDDSHSSLGTPIRLDETLEEEEEEEEQDGQNAQTPGSMGRGQGLAQPRVEMGLFVDFEDAEPTPPTPLRPHLAVEPSVASTPLRPLPVQAIPASTSTPMTTKSAIPTGTSTPVPAVGIPARRNRSFTAINAHQSPQQNPPRAQTRGPSSTFPPKPQIEHTRTASEPALPAKPRLGLHQPNKSLPYRQKETEALASPTIPQDDGSKELFVERRSDYSQKQPHSASRHRVSGVPGLRQSNDHRNHAFNSRLPSRPATETGTQAVSISTKRPLEGANAQQEDRMFKVPVFNNSSSAFRFDDAEKNALDLLSGD